MRLLILGRLYTTFVKFWRKFVNIFNTRKNYKIFEKCWKILDWGIYKKIFKLNSNFEEIKIFAEILGKVRKNVPV